MQFSALGLEGPAQGGLEQVTELRRKILEGYGLGWRDVVVGLLSLPRVIS